MKPTPGELVEALNQPNGYIYRIDPRYDVDGEIPGYGVIGAWKVNHLGAIEGDFAANPNYDSEKVKSCDLIQK